MNEPKWKKNPGYCPDEIIGNDVEVFIVDWESYSKRSRKPEYLDWKIDGIPHILKYRDWTAWAQENKRVWNGEGLPSVGERAKSPRGFLYHSWIRCTKRKGCSTVLQLWTS
jgi:hypothetical protein